MNHLGKDYFQFLSELKEKIKTTQFRAALSVNQHVIQLYWHIGKQIIEKQEKAQWGEQFLVSLAKDLQAAFPETRGFSVTNLKRMRIFAQTYPTGNIGPQLVDQLPWGHIMTLLHKVKDETQQKWYTTKSIEEGWSRLTLEKHIAHNLYARQALPDSKVSNFASTLPSPQSGFVQEILKNPYNFDFLGLHDDALERDIEHASTYYITKFLLELGKGFAFVGRQIPITVQEEEYFIDMLFYHLKLHAYVVIELKATKFKPEHAGQLNFYLNLADEFLKTPQDNPSIGLLLCKSHNKFVAEYALRNIDKPIGVSEYQLTQAIPNNLESSLPSVQEIEEKLNNLTDTK